MSGSKKKATDEELVAAYTAESNVWKVAKIFGMCGQSVHERLQRIGVDMGNFWSAEDEKFLKENYHTYRNNFRLQELAIKLGRSKQNVCRKARSFGLTSIKKEYTIGRRTVTKDGYVNIGHIGLEHINLAEMRLGRALMKGEVVHHIDRNRTNNDLNNLLVMSSSDHMSYHASKPRRKRRKKPDKLL